MTTALLQKLLENDVLTEDTKTSIVATFDTVITEAKEQARVEVTEELTAKFAEDFVKERDALVESIDELVTKAIAEHVAQSGTTLREHIESHKADIEAFRDLQAEQAEKLVEARESMVSSTKGDIKTLVEKLDVFLDKMVAEEFAEIREELVESQRNAMGAKIFEGFRNEFEQYYVQSTGIAGRVDKLTSELKAAAAKNSELQESLQSITRTQTLAATLAPLEGQSRKVMETILATVATDKLQETYDRFIDRVIKESAGKPAGVGTQSEKETQKVLAESKVDPKTVTLVTGNTDTAKKKIVTESVVTMSAEDKRRLLQSAGIVA